MQITDSQRRSSNPLDTVTRHIASALITTYQQKVSPRKEFSCAYRVLHRSESCSQYTKRTVLERGLGQALPLIQQRFQACKAANQTLKAQRQYCSTRQRDVFSVLPAIAPKDKRSTTLAHQPWMAIEDAPLDDDAIEPPNEHSEPGQEPPRQRRAGSGNFKKPPAVNGSSTTDGSPNNNCPDWGCDSLECASFGCDAIDCSNAADCNGFDCGSLDCGSCDVGSCDCSS